MNKIIAITFLATITSFSLQAQSNKAVADYINQYQQIAVDEMIRTGVPAAVTLAQGILESNAGQSDLVQASNNHFGIKCKADWIGDVVYHDDDSKGECFRSYPTPQDSYRDHSDFLVTRPNYSFLFNLDPTDYTDWAYGLKQARYATNPQYPQLLIKTIEDNNLEQYTEVALLRSKTINLAKAPESVQQRLAFESTSKITEPASEQTANNNSIISYPAGVFTINHTKVVYVVAGTSVYSLAKKYNVSYSKLLQYNEMDDIPVFTTSQLVYLEKKPKKCEKEYHVVSGKESVNDIARCEGIQLQSLLSYNNIQKNDVLKSGDKILLQGSTNSKKFFHL